MGKSKEAPTEERKWTPAQREAIRATGTGLLVSAAAGSGKTSVLAERCAYLVCDAQPRCNVSQLLVVTFTEAAAAEMKSRINVALHKRIQAEGNLDDPHLRRQLKMIEHANVSTLHGFCSRLLRQHFYRVGLDPNFVVLDGDQAALLRAEVVRELFHEKYEVADESFEQFVDAYGAGNDEPLMGLVVQTHELLCSMVNPEKWMQEAERRIEEGTNCPLDESELGKIYLKGIREKLQGLQQMCAANLRAMPRDFSKYAAYLKDLAATADSWAATLQSQGYDALSKTVEGFSAGRLPSYPNDTPGKEEAAALVKNVQEAMKDGDLKECLSFTAEEWRATLRWTLPYCRTFLSLVKEFGEDYRIAKSELRGLDFTDLERFTLDLLRDDDREDISPSATARWCQKQFFHVLVDEYQDINEVQDAILSLVSRESTATDETPSNLFCVGDVKQSIYRFRLANPERFLRKLESFSTPGTENTGRVIPLSSNFRSRAALLETINHVFARLMTEESSAIVYDESHRLQPGAEYPAELPGTFPGSPIELHLIADSPEAGDEEDESSTEMDRTEFEAAFIATRIRQMLGQNNDEAMQVIERQTDGTVTARPIRPGDCVILLRSPRFKADQYAEALRLRGIPVHSDRGAGFFQAIEIQDVMSLLKILDNRRQDIPLAAFLRSPLTALPNAEDALARIRVAYQDGSVPFHQAVVRYAAERNDEVAAALKDLFHQLDRWRTLARQRPLAELIWTLYEETGYLAYCAGLEDGAQRVANLHHLHERARQFGSFARQGLYRFLRFLESLEEETETSTPASASAAEDAVRIMSVHRSKGLEFPVVFMPDLGKRHNFSDARGSVLVDRNAYVGMEVMDERQQIKYPSLAHRMVSERIHRQTMAEELRLLYVAMTRAKEHLVLIGTCKEIASETWARKWAGYLQPLPAEDFFAARTFLDWLGPVAHMLGQHGGQTLQISSHTRAEVSAMTSGKDGAERQRSPDWSKLARMENLTPLPAQTDTSRLVTDRLGYQYPQQLLARKVPAVLSVTGWTKHGKAMEVGDGERRSKVELARPLATPKCTQDTHAAPAAVDRGSATHLALQYLDFTRPCSGKDLIEQLDRLVMRRLLSSGQKDLVDLAAIEWMIETKVGKLLRDNATSLRRELPFYLARNPGQILAGAQSDNPADLVMIRGRIDVCVLSNSGFDVIDYKTDNVEVGGVPVRAETYREQITLYREAMERIVGKKMTAAYLVFLTPRVIFQV